MLSEELVNSRFLQIISELALYLAKSLLLTDESLKMGPLAAILTWRNDCSCDAQHCIWQKSLTYEKMLDKVIRKLNVLPSNHLQECQKF